jgi:hypothetical protein
VNANNGKIQADISQKLNGCLGRKGMKTAT